MVEKDVYMGSGSGNFVHLPTDSQWRWYMHKDDEACGPWLEKAQRACPSDCEVAGRSIVEACHESLNKVR